MPFFFGAFHFRNSSAAPAYALAPGRASVNLALARTGVTVGGGGGVSSLALKLNFLNWIRAIRLILLEGVWGGCAPPPPSEADIFWIFETGLARFGY